MAKLIETKGISTHCDSCGATFPGDPADWYKRPCPKCGEHDIINDDDMEMYRKFVSMAGAMNEAAGDVAGTVHVPT